MMQKLKPSAKLSIFTGTPLLCLGLVAIVSIYSIGHMPDANTRYAHNSELVEFMVERGLDHLSRVNQVQSDRVDGFAKTRSPAAGNVVNP